jgi:hypothetical protein
MPGNIIINKNVNSNVEEIKAVTDNLPDSGALSSLAQDATVAKEATLGTPSGADIATDIATVDSNLSVTDSKVDTLLQLTASAPSQGTLSYLDAGGEQTVVEITTATRIVINGIWLDLTNITQNGTIKLYYKIDGANYREFASYNFVVATDSDGVYISINAGMNSDFKVTYTEDADEGAARDIPYCIIYDARE